MTVLNVLYFLCFISFFLYFYSLFLSLRHILGNHGSRLAYVAMCFVLSLIFVTCVHFALRVFIVYLLLLCLLFICFCVIFKARLSTLYWAAMHCTFGFICIRGLVTGVLSLSTGKSLYYVMASEAQRLLTLIISMLILVITLRLQLRVPSLREDLRQLFKFSEQMRFVNIIGSLMLTYQLFCTDSFFYSMDYSWLTLMLIFGDLLTIIGYLSILRQSVRSGIWVHNTWRTEALEVLLHRQLLHYRSYGQHTLSLRRFKHDYNKVVGSVRILLRAGERDKALAVLEEMDHCMQESISVHKQYSNDMLVDAVLHELADECLELGVDFSAGVMLPVWLKMPQLEINKLFSSLCTELSARCAGTCDGTRKRIKITGESYDTWLSIIAETTFSGKLDSLSSVPSGLDEPNLHSMALPSVRETVAQAGGFVNVEIDTVRCVYKVNIHISCSAPRSKETPL